MGKHALIVGGTGMLKKATLWLEANDYHVSAIGRDLERLQDVVKEAADKSRITPISVDYYKDSDLKAEINKTIQMNGPIDLVVAWIHSPAEHAFDVLNRFIASHVKEGYWKLFEIRGSGAYLVKKPMPVPVPSNCQYRKITLGFVIDEERSRWLTNNEIASGVITAVQTDHKETIIGTLEPWEKRP